MRLLNRVVSWTDRGIAYEADARHAEIIVRDLGLSKAKSVTRPGVKQSANDAASTSAALGATEATQCRSLAMRASYLAQDRADIQVATK